MTIGAMDEMIAYIPLVQKWSQGKDVTNDLMVIHSEMDVAYRMTFGGGIEQALKQVDEDELY